MQYNIQYSQENDGSWVALCLNYDIAIQGESFESVSISIKQEIDEYIEYAHTLPISEKNDLLNRTTP